MADKPKKRASAHRRLSAALPPTPLPGSGASKSQPRRPDSRIITLTTDFGQVDYFVGAMKGVILAITPDARIVDITHAIPAGNISAAAFNLLAVHRSFPIGSVHVAVIDPGVGSSRRAVIVETAGYWFVGPDNGIFSYILDNSHNARVIEIRKEKHFRHPASATFHGRDIFAPVAASLANGVPATEFGPKIRDAVRLQSLTPVRLKNGGLQGRILHIDHFGNCITSFNERELSAQLLRNGAALTVNQIQIKSFRRFFADQGNDEEKLFAILGSAGFVEIAAQDESAAKIIRARVGQRVSLKFNKDKESRQKAE